MKKNFAGQEFESGKKVKVQDVEFGKNGKIVIALDL
jgi:hypothetical protein